MIGRSYALTRRSFTLGAGALGVTALAGGSALAAAKKRGISVGYAAITWGDRSVKTAIEEIAAAGYTGIQLRAGSTKPKTETSAGTLSLMDEFKTPDALKAELEKHKLTFACISGGGLTLDPAKKAEEMQKFLTLAKFARAAGALSIQATSPRRDKPPEAADLKAFGEMIGELGKQTSAIGLPLVFHNHMNQIGEKADEVDAILRAAGPKVRVLLDTGHWAAPDPDGKQSDKTYQFVELGQGKVDFKGVFKALKASGFAGWAVVELDAVPAGRAPKDAAMANRDFLQNTVGLKV